jgi:hypothetical protein
MLNRMQKQTVFVVMSLVVIISSLCAFAAKRVPETTNYGNIVYRGLPVEQDAHHRKYVVVNHDTIHLDFAPVERHGALTEDDYREVAEELGVEVAAIKAVVEIEAGKAHQGFYNGKPIINFDLSMFRSMASRNGINLSKYSKSHHEVFARPNIQKYGSQQAAQHARLASAMTIDSLTAIQGTFWGMFQIGGFNWKKCGASRPSEFVMLMSRSERDQLELFAEFIRSTGLLKHLSNKNWAAFARGYNGPSYASRRYHTRLAQAYAKYSKK